MSNNKKDISKGMKNAKVRTASSVASKKPLPRAKSFEVTILPPEVSLSTVSEPIQYEAHIDKLVPLLPSNALAENDALRYQHDSLKSSVRVKLQVKLIETFAKCASGNTPKSRSRKSKPPKANLRGCDSLDVPLGLVFRWSMSLMCPSNG